MLLSAKGKNILRYFPDKENLSVNFGFAKKITNLGSGFGFGSGFGSE